MPPETVGGFPISWNEFLRGLRGESETLLQQLTAIADSTGAVFLDPHVALRTPPAIDGPRRMDHVGVYTTLDDYLPELRKAFASDAEFIEHFVSAYPRSSLILGVALLNRIAENEEQLAQLTDEFLGELKPTPAARLREFLNRDHARLLARQQLLAALKLLFVREEDAPSRSPDVSTPVISGILLAHAVGSLLAANQDSKKTLAGYPADLAMEITRLSLMYASEDEYAAIDRVIKLWRSYGNRISTYPLRKTPEELLQEATGLTLEVLLGLGFLLYANSVMWDPHKAPFMPRDLGSDLDETTKETFIRLISDNSNGFSHSLKGREAPFDYLPIQEKPVLDTPTGLLVLDAAYLWERITSGLYWFVHDHEKSLSESNREQWNQAFSEMVELMVEDQLRAMAVPDLTGDKTVYTEEDFAGAYQGKQCDIGLLLSPDFLMVEIVSGRLSVRTRIEGDPEKFEEDTEKLVLSKCRQLDEASKSLLADESRLTGHAPTEGLRVVPLVVVGGGYPLNIMTNAYIRSELVSRGILQDARLDRVGIIDLGELDILEALSEQGENPAITIRNWQSSESRDTSFKNYVIASFGSGIDYRPSRMTGGVEKAFQEVISNLRLRADAS